jgi:hypothetical protein
MGQIDVEDMSDIAHFGGQYMRPAAHSAGGEAFSIKHAELGLGPELD